MYNIKLAVYKDFSYEIAVIDRGKIVRNCEANWSSSIINDILQRLYSGVKWKWDLKQCLELDSLMLQLPGNAFLSKKRRSSRIAF